MRDTLGKRIKLQRRIKGMTQSELADKLGYSNKASISQIEAGKVSIPDDKLETLSQIFDVPVDYLTGDNAENTDVKLSEFECSNGVYIDNDLNEYITLPKSMIKPNTRYFTNTARGDSMIGKGIIAGDILIFESCNFLDNGRIGSMTVNDSYYCRVYRRITNNIVILESANNSCDPIIVDLKTDDFRIIGRLIASFRKY